MTQLKKETMVVSGIGAFDQTGLSEARRSLANAQLRRMEALVDMGFEGLASLQAIAGLFRSGFNLMRHEVRVSEGSSANTRLVG